MDCWSWRYIGNILLASLGSARRRLSLLFKHPWQSAADKITAMVLNAPQTSLATSQAFLRRDGQKQHCRQIPVKTRVQAVDLIFDTVYALNIYWKGVYPKKIFNQWKYWL
jgi:hypothetical protein